MFWHRPGYGRHGGRCDIRYIIVTHFVLLLSAKSAHKYDDIYAIFAHAY